jgi:membrane protein implicated in regulation of membrane protease activity
MEADFSIGLYWHWLVFGLFLIGLELLVLPGAFFLWVGLAALTVGGIALIFPLSLIAGLLIFSPLALLITWAGKSYVKNNLASDAPLLNRRSEQMVGSTIILDKAIINGQAQVTVGDSVWNVRGADLPAGSHVVVKSVEGNTLMVLEKT